QQAEVIQLALAVLSINPATGQPEGEVAFYSGLQQPQHPIAPEVTALTGITNDMVQGQQLNHSRVAQMMQGVDWVVAHNAAFDRPFVDGMGEWFAQAAWVCSWQDVDWGAAAGSLKL
ncbi:MAG: exonuclease domain-containing protein, partial [Burkholderiaceae bacterium]